MEALAIDNSMKTDLQYSLCVCPELQNKRLEQKRRAAGTSNLYYGQFVPEVSFIITSD